MQIKEFINNLKEKLLNNQEIHHTRNLIILDPGHGGKDLGLKMNGVSNEGYNGILEKNINLEICTKIAWFCNKHGIGYLMTRWGDRQVSLKKRCEIANQTKAKVFLSVHCNYAKQSSVRGVEVWHYTGTLVSRILATKCQQKLVELMYTRDRGVKNNRSFYVLKNTRMPAILVELGFLSNPQDAISLNDEENQFMIAEKLWEVLREVI